MVAPIKRTHRAHLVQTATAWGTWTDQPDLIANQASEGAGQSLGSTLLRYRLGTVRQPGAAGNPGTVTPLSGFVGRWVRILIADPAGTITAQSKTWSALWHGEALSVIRTDEGGGMGEQALRCLGVAYALSRLRCNRGAEKRFNASGGGPDNLVNPGYLPPFNAEPGGDMYGTDVTVGGPGDVCKCHTRGQVGDAANTYKWTAKEILRTILALFARGQLAPTYAANTPLTWTISDPNGLLSWSPTNLDLNGRTVLDAINALINPRQGLTWHVEVSGNQAVIVPDSLSPAAITSGPFTLAASTRAVTPDLSTSHFIRDPSLTEDQSATFDVIRVLGSNPWVACTVAYRLNQTSGEEIVNGAKKSWSDIQESVYVNGQSTLASLQGVLRRFTLSDKWTGNCYGSATIGLRNIVGIDGSRTFNPATDTWAPQSLEVTTDLPVSPGFSTLAKGPRQQAVAVLADGQGNFLNLTGDTPLEAAYRYQLSAESNPPAIWLGQTPDDANRTYKLLNDVINRPTLYLTIGIREPAPLQVEWQRTPGQQPRDLPRVLTVTLPDCEQWLALGGCVSGTTTDGRALTRISDSGVTARDDSLALQQHLALLRAFYAEPARDLSWFDAGIIDTSQTYGPGALVTSATLSTGSATINATITTRSWDLTEEGFGTTYTTTRLFSPMDLYA